MNYNIIKLDFHQSVVQRMTYSTTMTMHFYFFADKQTYTQTYIHIKINKHEPYYHKFVVYFSFWFDGQTDIHTSQKLILNPNYFPFFRIFPLPILNYNLFLKHVMINKIIILLLYATIK